MLLPDLAPNPETLRARALAKVYALLLRLAEENETTHPENFAEDIEQATRQIDPKKGIHP